MLAKPASTSEVVVSTGEVVGSTREVMGSGKRCMMEWMDGSGYEGTDNWVRIQSQLMLLLIPFEKRLTVRCTIAENFTGSSTSN